MKKRLISLILAAIVLLSCAFAEESQSEEYLLPYIDLYAVPLGDNAIFEIPNEWGYQTLEDTDVPPTTSLLTDQNQMVMAMKLPADWEATDASDALGIQSFIVEGTALMLGLTTPQSTRLQEMTINDMPAVLVSMNGQGFDILWIGDSGDLYFFLFPNDDDALVQQMIAVAQSLCVFHRKGAGQSRVGFCVYGGRRRGHHHRLHRHKRTCADSAGNRRSAGDGAGGQGVL